MRALIIGFGSIGKKHFMALRNLGHEVSILSLSAKKDELENIKLYTCFEECNLHTFDLFIIANITTEHFRTLKELDGLVSNKIILVEKPLFEKDLEFKSCQNTIFVGYLLRFHPVILALRELLSNEDIYFASLLCNSYLPHYRNADYRQNYSAKKELGGGVLLDLSHELDLAFFLFGNLNLMYYENTKISELQITSDDFAFLALKNSKDTIIHIQLDYFSKFNKRKIIIHTLKKSLSADLLNNNIKIYSPRGLIRTFNFENDTIKNLQRLHEAVLKKDENVCTLEEARRILKLSDRIKNG